MEGPLQAETGKLLRSWMRYDAAELRDYLVADVEDPRINVQSILSRHFLVRALFPDSFEALMREEYRFAAAVNSLMALFRSLHDEEEAGLILNALRRRSDNAEGIAIPHLLIEEFRRLPAAADSLEVPNYLQALLEGVDFVAGQPRFADAAMLTFARLWAKAMGNATPSPVPLQVLEPACGSANDYRFLGQYGLAGLLDYTGFDLCPKNIENARAMFPGTRFETANVFEIPASDAAYDVCFVHDLLEHLSFEGLERAVRELCRVTRRAFCVHFFNMDEVPEHVLRPVENYHWNTLSVSRTRELFASLGFEAQVVHIGAFLLKATGAEDTHNPNAYTFILWR